MLRFRCYRSHGVPGEGGGGGGQLALRIKPSVIYTVHVHSLKLKLSTLGPKLALTRSLRLCSNFLISPELALSCKLVHSRHCKVDTNLMCAIHSTKIQAGPTGKSGSPQKLFRLVPIDPLSFGPKFPVELMDRAQYLIPLSGYW